MFEKFLELFLVMFPDHEDVVIESTPKTGLFGVGVDKFSSKSDINLLA